MYEVFTAADKKAQSDNQKVPAFQAKIVNQAGNGGNDGDERTGDFDTGMEIAGADPLR